MIQKGNKNLMTWFARAVVTHWQAKVNKLLKLKVAKSPDQESKFFIWLQQDLKS